MLAIRRAPEGRSPGENSDAYLTCMGSESRVNPRPDVVAGRHAHPRALEVDWRWVSPHPWEWEYMALRACVWAFASAHRVE